MLHARIRLFVLSVVAIAGLLAGCSPSHQTVEWYMEHKAERDAKLKWCNDDMSRATDVDCLNATKAKERAMVQGPSAADTFKFNAGAVPQGNGGTSSAPAPANSQKSAADTFKFDPNKVPKGGQ